MSSYSDVYVGRPSMNTSEVNTSIISHRTPRATPGRCRAGPLFGCIVLWLLSYRAVMPASREP